jgi:hypothetical protein
VREERKERQAAQKAAYEAEQEGGEVPGEEVCTLERLRAFMQSFYIHI